LVLEVKAIGHGSVAAPVVSRPGFGLQAVLALPLLGAAVYLAFYTSGLWLLGSVQLTPRVFYGGPVPHLTFAAIMSLGMLWYRAARPAAALAGAAMLFVLLSLISIGHSAAVQQLVLLLPRATMAPAVLALSLTVNVLTSAAVMVVARSVAPALRRLSYWLVALILWPFATFLLSTAAPILTVNLELDQASMSHVFFGVLLARQCIIFGCIGYWLDRDNRHRDAISRVF
jgi:hypothetical protein